MHITKVYAMAAAGAASTQAALTAIEVTGNISALTQASTQANLQGLNLTENNVLTAVPLLISALQNILGQATNNTASLGASGQASQSSKVSKRQDCLDVTHPTKCVGDLVGILTNPTGAQESQGSTSVSTGGSLGIEPTGSGSQVPDPNGEDPNGEQSPDTDEQQSPDTDGQQSPDTDGQQSPDTDGEQSPDADGQQSPDTEGQQGSGSSGLGGLGSLGSLTSGLSGLGGAGSSLTGGFLGSSAGNAVLKVRQAAATPSFSADDQQNICDSFSGFASAQSQLMTTMVNKHELLSLTSFTAPLSALLEGLGGGFDALTSILVAKVPTCATSMQQAQTGLSQNIDLAIQTYSS